MVQFCKLVSFEICASKQCIVKSQTREGVKFRLSPVGFVDDDISMMMIAMIKMTMFH